jgi:uncharacterized protein YbaP (TraB family)
MKRWMLIAVFLPLFIEAKSSVWKITNDANASIYLAGTIHLLRHSDYPLPHAYQYAYDKSDVLVFETNLQDESIGEYMGQKSLYPKGIELKDKLSPKIYQALEAYSAKVGFPLVLVSRMRVSLAMFSISLHKIQAMGFYPKNGVDQYFYTQALQDHKKILHLESPKEQMDMLIYLGEGREDEMVEYTLRDLRNIEEYFKILLQAWRSGDREGLEDKLLKDMQEYPEIYYKLLVNRNQKWLITMQRYFQSSEVEFILVGAGHLVGEDGLLHYYEKRGYRVEQLFNDKNSLTLKPNSI